METTSCDTAPSMSTPTVAEPSSACLDAAVTPASAPTGPAPATPVDVAPLTGDSPSVGVGAPTCIKPEPAVAQPPPPLPPSVDPPAAAPVEMPPPSPTPAVVEAPPPQPPPMPSPSVREPTETAPARPPTTPPTPEVVAAAPEVRPTPAPESTAATVASAPQPAAQAAPLPSPELPSPASPKPDADKAVVADGPVPRTTAQPPRPTRRPVKLGLSGAPPFHQPSASSASSVTPTPSTSTVQSSVTSPRSEQPGGPDDGATSSSRNGPAATCGRTSDALPERGGRAPAPTRPAAVPTSPHVRCVSCVTARPPTQPGTVPHVTARPTRRVRRSGGRLRTVAGARAPVTQRVADVADRQLPVVDRRDVDDAHRQVGDRPRQPRPLGRSHARPGSSRPCRAPRRGTKRRHRSTEYRRSVAAEPDDVRPSRRTRENTRSQLFGADQPDSPRSAAAAFAAVEGLPPKPLATLTLMRVRVDARRLAVRVGLTDQLGVGVSGDADGWWNCGA